MKVLWEKRFQETHSDEELISYESKNTDYSVSQFNEWECQWPMSDRKKNVVWGEWSVEKDGYSFGKFKTVKEAKAHVQLLVAGPTLALVDNSIMTDESGNETSQEYINECLELGEE